MQAKIEELTRQVLREIRHRSAKSKNSSVKPASWNNKNQGCL
jgi:hypothetical protein